MPRSLHRKIKARLRKREKGREELANLAASVEEKIKEAAALRESRREELLQKYKEILVWLNEFFHSPDGKQAFKLRRRITLFAAKFFFGLPADPRDDDVCAFIRLYRDGSLTYVEKFKEETARRQRLGSITSTDLADLYQFLHPDFLDQWLEAIRDGRTWLHIESSLR